MMSATGRRATNQKETHHDPTIQEVITFFVRMQVSCCILSEISVSDIQGRYRRVHQAIDLSIVSAERASRNSGIECAARSCTFGSVNSAEILGVGVHGLVERKSSIEAVPTV